MSLQQKSALAASLCERGEFAQAEALYRELLAVDPRDAGLHFSRARAQYGLGQLEDALVSLERTVELRPDAAPAHMNRGTLYRELRRWQAALDCYDHALRLQPRYADAHLNRGVALFELGQHEAALASYDRALAMAPDSAAAHYNRGNVLRTLRQLPAALAAYERAAALQPDIPFLAGDLLDARMQMCDWTGFDAAIDGLAQLINRGTAAIDPFSWLAYSGDSPLQLRAAQTWVQRRYPPDAALGPLPAPTAGHRLRIGYFSADFREHPLSWLMAAVFESHDRSAVEALAFSFGPDTGDPLRRRLEAAFDRFIDVRTSTDRDIAALARQLQVDIAVDLGGFTEECRAGIFALRAAPLQVGYLGYLGTMGAPYMDYLIADPVLVTDPDRAQYAEHILCLPSYQANDPTRRAEERVYSRAELGLPAHGVVFCCFNNNFKLTPPTFAAWMRILARVPDAVLWLYAHSEAVVANLRREAQGHGIAADRLVFATRVPYATHLARLRAADLFLDTWPYNAGATASDALWQGLPVLTLRGTTFAGRIGASVLTAAGLPDLIAATAAQYEDQAVELALAPAALATLRQRLAAARLTAPLFDVRRFTRSLEEGFARIHARHLAGLPPAHIEVQD